MKKSLIFAVHGAMVLASHGSAVQAATITETKIIAENGVENDYFGYSVAVSGSTAIVGAFGDDYNGAYSGAAYLFDTNSGTQIAKLIASDGLEGDNFGRSVAISGGMAIVGAYADNGNNANSGAAYLFDIDTGAQVSKLSSGNAMLHNGFGVSAGISDTIAIVGAYSDYDPDASGSAYLFDVNTGKQLFELNSSDGVAGDVFGYSVAISGNQALVGAMGADGKDTGTGAAYIFDTLTGAQTAKLVANDGMSDDAFGRSVSIHNNIAIIGAYGREDYGGSGSVYLFDTITGNQISKLTGTSGELFGYSVDVFNDIIAIGAIGADGGENRVGAVYLFDLKTGVELAKVHARDGSVYGGFGAFVDLDENSLLVGAYSEQGSGVSSSAYIYSIETAAVPLPAGGWFLGAALGVLAVRRRGRVISTNLAPPV